jgi:hypothetical protein
LLTAQELEHLGVGFVSLTKALDLTRPAGRSMVGLLAEFEREILREGTRAGLAHPMRGPRPDSSWKGWWGANPPYHAETFVLTHYEREPLVMEGGTTFHFVISGIEDVLRLAKQAAGNKDVKIGGGVSTVPQYL